MAAIILALYFPMRLESDAEAAEVRYELVATSDPIFAQQAVGHLYLDGVIEKGDLERLKSAANGGIVLELVLHSPGGDVQEALRIADYVQEKLILVRAPDRSFVDENKGSCDYVDRAHPQNDDDCTCASACSIIWLLAPLRDGAFIILHRPRFDYGEYAGMTLLAAKKKYEAMVAEVKARLVDGGVDEQIVRQMLDTPSTEQTILDIKKVIRMGEYQPYLDELLTASCTEFLNEHQIYAKYETIYDAVFRDWMSACVNKQGNSCPEQKARLEEVKSNSPPQPTNWLRCRNDAYRKLLVQAQTRK